jgi:predicted amidohydrolase
MMNREKHFNVLSLEAKTHKRYQQNLDSLIEIIENHPHTKLIVAPEVFLTDFDYMHMSTAATFNLKALKAIKKALQPEQIAMITLILQEEDGFVNQAVVIHKNKLIHTQNKSKLFALGQEDNHFIAGKEKKIKVFEIEGVKFGILICFELRFKQLWQQLEGVDIIVIPAMWGKARKHHLRALSRALAIMNQCYVVVSNSANDDMGGGSAIITPDGEVKETKEEGHIVGEIDFQEIKKMRRYIVINNTKS